MVVFTPEWVVVFVGIRRLDEYAYNLGFLRKDFGVRSNAYGDLAVSVFHRHGFTDSLTLGAGGQATRDRFNLDAEAQFLTGIWGLWEIAGAGSRDRQSGKSGGAASLGYSYQNRKFSFGLAARGYSEHFARISQQGQQTSRPKLDLAARMGYSLGRPGNLALSYSRADDYVESDSDRLSLNYSLTMSSNLSLFASIGRVRQAGACGLEASVGISYYPNRDLTSNLLFDKRVDQGNTLSLRAGKLQPVGEGLGYDLTIEHRPDSTELSPNVQYNGRYGIYRAEARSVQTDGGERSRQYRASLAGGIGYVARRLGFSRPFRDSFGLVRIGEVDGVRVYRNNQEIGRTDASGSLFVPDMTAFNDNHIRIEDRDVPIEYALERGERHLAPAYRGGALVDFPVQRIYAFVGYLKIRKDGQLIPAEYGEVKIETESGPVRLPTVRDGEFYFENLAPGSYTASYDSTEGTCRFT